MGGNWLSRAGVAAKRSNVEEATIESKRPTFNHIQKKGRGEKREERSRAIEGGQGVVSI